MATQFGTAAPFGLTDETGVLTDGITWNYVQQNKRILDADGDPKTVTYYGEGIEGTISGYLPTSSPFGGTLAASLTLATSPTDYLKGSVGALTIVESVSVTHSNEDYRRIEIGFSNYAGIPS